MKTLKLPSFIMLAETTINALYTNKTAADNKSMTYGLSQSHVIHIYLLHIIVMTIILSTYIEGGNGHNGSKIEEKLNIKKLYFSNKNQ